VTAAKKPLWACPKCGAKLVTRNLSHACGDYSVEKFLAGKGAHARAMFARFEALVAACGPYDVAPAKTRVAFMARVRFASVNRLTDDALDFHFVLPREIASPRLRRVEKLGTLWVHHVRVTEPRELDREVGRWLRMSYVDYGEQTWREKKRRKNA
jgi:hypothetical protein